MIILLSLIICIIHYYIYKYTIKNIYKKNIYIYIFLIYLQNHINFGNDIL